MASCRVFPSCLGTSASPAALRSPVEPSAAVGRVLPAASHSLGLARDTAGSFGCAAFVTNVGSSSALSHTPRWKVSPPCHVESGTAPVGCLSPAKAQLQRPGALGPGWWWPGHRGCGDTGKPARQSAQGHTAFVEQAEEQPVQCSESCCSPGCCKLSEAENGVHSF